MNNGSKGNVLVTSEGTQVRLKPVAQYLITGVETSVKKEFAERGKSIEPPEYEVTTIAGTIERHTHDETTLEDPSDPKKTEENRIAWANYKSNVDAYNIEYNARLSKLCIYFGVEHDKEDYQKGSWKEEQKFFGIDIPEEEPDRLIHYLSTVILKTPSDMFETVMRVINLSMDGAVGEESINAAMASFRDQVRSAGKEAVAFGRVATEEGEVVA